MNFVQTDDPQSVLNVSNGQFSYAANVPNSWSLLVKQFEVFRGTLTVIRGGNMSGKTTLLNLLSGRQTFSNTDVHLRFNGEATSPALLRQQTALLSNDDPMFPELSIWDNIRIGLPLAYDSTPQRWRAQAVAFLTQSAIETKWNPDHPLSSLSTGGRALVKLCRAIIGRHSLVIIDEISSYLDDMRAVYFIEQVFYLLDEKSAVIFVTHNPRDRTLISEITRHRAHHVRYLEVVRSNNRSELVEHAGD